MNKKGNLKMLHCLIRRAPRRLRFAGSPVTANPAGKLGAAHDNLGAAHENLRAAHEKSSP
jgi:hypothetical protein